MTWGIIKSKSKPNKIQITTVSAKHLSENEMWTLEPHPVRRYLAET